VTALPVNSRSSAPPRQAGDGLKRYFATADYETFITFSSNSGAGSLSYVIHIDGYMALDGTSNLKEMGKTIAEIERPSLSKNEDRPKVEF
jgi:hypothetical protein